MGFASSGDLVELCVLSSRSLGLAVQCAWPVSTNKPRVRPREKPSRVLPSYQETQCLSSCREPGRGVPNTRATGAGDLEQKSVHTLACPDRSTPLSQREELFHVTVQVGGSWWGRGGSRKRPQPGPRGRSGLGNAITRTVSHVIFLKLTHSTVF